MIYTYIDFRLLIDYMKINKNQNSYSEFRNNIIINIEKLNKKHKRDNYLYSIRSDFLSKVLYHIKIEEIIEAIDLFV